MANELDPPDLDLNSEEKASLLNQPIGRRTFLKGFVGVTALTALGVGNGYANTFPSEIRLERVPVKLTRLPDAFHGFKIAQLSDLHSSPFVDLDHLVQAAKLARNEQPDLVVLTGDYIGHTLRTRADEEHPFDPVYVDNIVKALSVIEPRHGFLAVLGNHDFWSGREATRTLVREFIKGLDAQWLRNRHVSLERDGEFIDIAGVDDYWQSTFMLERALKKVHPERVKILLSHNPDINEILKPNHDLDLVLSGHTHGGQIVFPVLGTRLNPVLKNQRYVRGLVRDGARQTYITRGVGHVVVPIRYNCAPEVSLLLLEKAGM